MLSNRALVLSAALALLMALGLFSVACTGTTGSDAASTAADDASDSTATTANALDAFGIEANGYDVEEQAIRRNQTFSDLVQPYGISPRQVHQIATDEALREVFDVRRIRAGRTMHVYRDSTDTARLLVYERDQINYVTIDLRDGISATEGARDVQTRQRTVHGVIESSPYRALQRAGASPHLAVQLANVLAWQVDFYRIQRGDRFTIVYEQDYIDDEPVRLGRILATRFEHAGREHTALYYAHSEGTDYFNEDGESMRKAFLRAPLEYSRISSRYSRNRTHPVHGRNVPHLGTDYAAPTGTPIRATGTGTVVRAGYTRGNGNYVKIRHNSTYSTQYLHMSRFASGISRGTRVEQGEVIGYVGQTGLATGPHLCYRFWKNGQQVDPFRLEFPSGDPVPEADRNGFEEQKTRLMAALSRAERQQQIPALAGRSLGTATTELET